MKSKFIWILGFLLFSACKEKIYLKPIFTNEFKAPTKNAILVHLKLSWNDTPLIFNDKTYINTSGNSLTFQNVRYLLSQLQLEYNGQKITFPFEYGLLNSDFGIDSFYIDSIPNGVYNKLNFVFGLDSLTNHSDPANYAVGHPLNPFTSQLHWGWASGYIFLVTEGTYHIPNQSTDGFIYHLVGDNFKRNISLNMPSITIQDNVKEITLHLDLYKLFDSPNKIDLSKSPYKSIPENDSVIAPKLVQNLTNSFKITQ